MTLFEREQLPSQTKSIAYGCGKIKIEAECQHFCSSTYGVWAINIAVSAFDFIAKPIPCVNYHEW